MEFNILCKAPKDFCDQEIESIINLVYNYRPIDLKFIRKRLLEAKSISIAKSDNEIIATATLKLPNDIYLDDAFTKSNSEYQYSELWFELGYVVVKEEFRNQSLATFLIRSLCENNKYQNIFAVTDAENIGSINAKLRNGFIQSGKEFQDRKSEKLLKLFVLNRK